MKADISPPDLGREEPSGSPPSQAARLRQARLLVEVARRVAFPADALPPGNVEAVLLGLWREATYWALSAAGGVHDRSGELAVLWQRVDPHLLTRAAGREESVPAFRALLLDESRLTPFQMDTRAGVTAARRLGDLVEGLIDQMERPARLRARRQLGRWARLTALVLAAAAAVWTIVAVATARPDLAAGRPFRTSSALFSCEDPAICGNAFFHTREEDAPWIEYDLGKPTSIRQVEVTNRSDCCLARAAPLVIELSQDQKSWTEVARQPRVFGQWTAGLGDQMARYVRLRVDRRTMLHLEKVVLR